MLSHCRLVQVLGVVDISGIWLSKIGEIADG
jgi:hypothetical protein